MSQKIIHLLMGSHKTATTSFQRTLALHQDALLTQGISFPLIKTLEEKHGLIDNHSIPIYSGFTSHPERYHMNVRWEIDDLGALNDYYRDQLVQVLKTEERVVLCGEDISLLRSDELKDLKSFLAAEGHQVLPCAVVRSPYSFHCSIYQQRIRSGFYLPFSEFR